MPSLARALANDLHGIRANVDAIMELEGILTPPEEKFSSWTCLVEHCENVLRHSTKETNTVLEIVLQSMKSKSPGYMTLDKSASAQSAYSANPGSLLPSLVTGLCLFSHHVAFAMRLIPRLIEMLKGLDRLCAVIQEIGMGQQARRFGSISFSGDSPMASRDS